MRRAGAPRSCSPSSASRIASRRARATSRTAISAVSRSRERWPSSPSCSCSTSRHEHRREASAERSHPKRPRQIERHHSVDRAPRPPRDGSLRSHRRAQLRPAHRARRAGRRAEGSRRDRGLPGRRGMSAEASGTPLLRVEDLSIRYGHVQALERVSLEVRAGEVVTLIGANGAGKSTTLRSISRTVPIHSGHIAFEARDISGARPSDVVRLGIAQVPEGRRMLARQTVLDNLVLGAYTRSDASEIQADIERQFGRFPRLAERRNQLAGTLSGGEQQMLAIARALMSRPRLLLLDEPSLGLAPLIVRGIFDIIGDLHQSGVTILLVEQNARLALQIADRAYVLEAGRLTISGPSSELLNDERVRRAYLG